MTAREEATVAVLRPRFQGANIQTWVGFKHFFYLVEEGVLQWFRQRGFGPQTLYHEHAHGLEIVDLSAVLPALLEIDDEVTAEVVASRPGRFAVRLRVERGERRTLVLRGKVAVALIPEKGPQATRLPTALDALAARDVAAVAKAADRRDRRIAAGEDERSVLAPRGGRTFYWPWLARYFHCHYSDRVQHSAYVRALEEVVDRFLADRGLAIDRLLRERSWIPVVSRARVRLLADAHMGETIHTTFAVEEVLKRQVYSARMDCYVRRDDILVHTATALIMHGYAISRGEQAGRLVELDDAVIAALRGEP